MRRDHTRLLRLGLGGASALLVVAVGALVANASSGATSPTARGVVTVTFADKGKTVDLTKGQTLRVVLDNTYWSTSAPHSNSPTLTRLGSVQVVGRLAHCVPGEGCGTVTVRFHAAAAGSAVVSSSRVSCGEVLRCTGGNGSFYVNVVVK